MSQNRSARCVFVGNIPYDATEEQLIEIFQQVGPVVSFRLVFDRETGKPKGYGFCEYRDAETALSAMRNLNNYDFNGRPLRVDFAEQEKQSMQQAQQRQQQARSNVPPPNPAPQNVPSTPDTINTVLDGMNTAQLYELVSKMKIMIQQNPDQARQILISNPPLSYALLHAQSILGMLNIQTIQKILSNQQQQQQQQQPNIPSMAMAPPQQPQPMQSIQGTAPSTASSIMGGMGFPPFASAMPNIPPGMMPGMPGFPPQMGFQTSIPQAGVTTLPSPFDGIPESQKVLIQQLLQLTPDQIDKLPPEHRSQVLSIKQALLGYH